MSDNDAYLGWHVISGIDLLTALQKVETGETADMVYMEMWANATRPARDARRWTIVTGYERDTWVEGPPLPRGIRVDVIEDTSRAWRKRYPAEGQPWDERERQRRGGSENP